MSLRRMMSAWFLIVVSAVVVRGQADPARLSLDRIFASGEFRPEFAPPHEWMEAGAAYTALEPSATLKEGKDLVRHDCKTGGREVLVAAERIIPAGASKPLSVEHYNLSKDGKRLLIFTNSQKVWRQNTRGDYWVLDRPSGKLTKLGGDAASASLFFAKLSPDGSRAGYVRAKNLYVEDLTSGHITPLTNDGSHTVINGTSDWVNEEELFIRDAWRWSPDGKAIAYWQFNTEGVPEYTLINDLAGLYPQTKTFAYPKAGQKNSACRIGVVSASGGPTQWLDLPGDSRNHYVATLDWAGNSEEIVLERLNRLQNENQVILGDARTGQTHPILTERDAAWVDIHDDGFHWLAGGKAFTWISERDGWRHVYVVSRDGTDVRCATPGSFDVIRLVKVDEPGGWIYYYASPDNATQCYLYRAPLTRTGSPERITPWDQPGWHDYQVSADNAWAFHTHSSFGQPPVQELVQLPTHKVAKTLAANDQLRSKFQGLKRGPSEFLRLDIGGGVQLDAWIMKPPDFDASKKYPLLFHVYGEPAGTTVVDRWGFDQYLWHLFLTQQGYLVASVDNRGTPAPRGRDWRKIVYRKLGVMPAQDQAAAARVFAKRPEVDPARIGIWGASGGGSMTLNMLFRYPDIYHVGMSLAPVPDMRYYDTIYQERYMGLPQDNAEDYKQGSPITFAGRLQGNLLLIHGTGDDNVHYQGSEALVDALVAANKQFTVMAYPNRTHALSEGTNTRRHLFELMTRFLREHLPAGKAR
jgi:dipeptidyl-peptidase-4